MLAFPLFAISVWWFVYSLRNPLKAGLLGLSFFYFSLQFLLGVILYPFVHDNYDYINIYDVLLAFSVFYVFWGSVAILSFIWKTRLEYAVVPQIEEPYGGTGIFANLVKFSLDINIFTILILFAFSIIVRYVMLKAFSLGASGAATESTYQNVPYYALAVWDIINTSSYAFVFVAAVQIFYRKGWIVPRVLIMVIEAFLDFARGRRPFMITIMLVLFAMICAKSKARFKTIIIGGILLFLCVHLFFPFFYFMREEWKRGETSPLVMLQIAAERVATERGLYNINIQGRLMNIGVNYVVAHRINEGIKTPNGEFLKVAVLSMVPRALFPNKWMYVTEPDVLLDRMLGLEAIQVVDIPSNVGIFALTDFGWFLGGIIYAFIFVGSIRFVEWIMRSLSYRSSIGVILCFSIIANCPVMQMEFTMNDLMISIRNIVILFVVFYLWGALFGGARQTAEEIFYEESYDDQSQ